MAVRLASDKKVLRISSNSVQRTISNMVEDRAYIKKIVVITLCEDNVYRVNASEMKEEERLAMCEIAKKKIMDRIFKD